MYSRSNRAVPIYGCYLLRWLENNNTRDPTPPGRSHNIAKKKNKVNLDRNSQKQAYFLMVVTSASLWMTLVQKLWRSLRWETISWPDFRERRVRQLMCYKWYDGVVIQLFKLQSITLCINTSLGAVSILLEENEADEDSVEDMSRNVETDGTNEWWWTQHRK